jgi:hypothetical protein
MNYLQIMQAACRDELEKISGELQGFTRIGRKPIGVERMIEREAESEVTPTDIVEKATAEPTTEPKVEKTSGATALKVGGGAILGIGGYHLARKANADRKLGRQVRIQSQQQGQ